jgi:transposase-like protein
MEYLDSSSRVGGEVVAAAAGASSVEVAGPRAGRPVRRSFSAEEKRRLVAEYDATPRGQKGAMLRRERLYDSHITEWRAAIAAGTLGTPPKRGRPKGSRTTRTPEQARIAELERENARLRADLEATEQSLTAKDDALEVLGKGVAFLEALSSRNAR